MSLKFVELKIKGYDRVVHATNEITKLDCIIAILESTLNSLFLINHCSLT